LAKITTSTSNSELAGVLGHEIAHVTCQHGVKRLQNQMGYSLFLSTHPPASERIKRIKKEIAKLKDNTDKTSD